MDFVKCFTGGNLIPQRERVLFLARLATLFVPVTGLFTAFTAVDGYPVLNVMPLEIPGRAATVGCGYREGQWWFCYARTGEQIRPVNELGAAAHQIRADVERAAP
ncbi:MULTISPECIES: hypothetical protein [unclassified Spirillospora]|uniref:hypothetical protein n=1 Tax=unclassified Spirillospora TaxID=2642701 RepID=UPI003713F17A